MDISNLSLSELYELRRQTRARIEELEKEAIAKNIARAWEWVRHMAPGEALWCHATGTFLGGPLQRGDKVTVYAVQPRKKLLWINLKTGRTISFNPWNIHRYNLQLDKPAKPIDPATRKMAHAFGKIVENYL